MIDYNDLFAITSYLREQGLISPEQVAVHVEKAGEGNMNKTLRVVTDDGNIILKQANPYVEKYPWIPAPQDRVLNEAYFYEKTSSIRVLKSSMPVLLGVDTTNYTLFLEDLGRSGDMTRLYKKGQQMSEQTLFKLLEYLTTLHSCCIVSPDDTPPFNMELRRLNFQHIFDLPFSADNGFNLDDIQPGLAALADDFRGRFSLKNRVKELGDAYLGTGDRLLHGDFFPGAWLETQSGGLKVIDPEFCFYGPVSFDWGVLLAHLYLSQHPESLIEKVTHTFRALPFISTSDISQLNGFAALEIIRRLIGQAQLPLEITLEEKSELLKLVTTLF